MSTFRRTKRRQTFKRVRFFGIGFVHSSLARGVKANIGTKTRFLANGPT
ncbi:hypothetical protein HanXRQr2_Chr07g0278891 [Helianthus annuus]|uniref:Uncharacterized protein n=1 Tax=Helianthus annuus TaxID=4232 RepID=A0A9K3IIS8_HELAN|nr:hypothetical protein HanXRQr2_Chr07g0278891 [Helianthus annuus]